MKKEIKHEVTEEEVEEVIAEEPKSGYRECTCGALVALPMEGEEATVCECGVKHLW